LGKRYLRAWSPRQQSPPTSTACLSAGAVSGSTAERVGTDSPAPTGQTLTLDSLVARADAGTIRVGRDTTVILDKAGIVDHKRLDELTELVERSGAKLIAVGYGKQLSSIGPGGMFDRLACHVPAAELADIRRTKDPSTSEHGKHYVRENQSARRHGLPGSSHARISAGKDRTRSGSHAWRRR